MIYLALPIGYAHGWGICGKYTTREMANLTGPDHTRLITQPFNADTVGDELEFRTLLPLALTQDQLNANTIATPAPHLNAPLLSCIVDKQMLPMFNIRGTRTVGYTFFEENIFSPQWIENARRHFDAVSTGSTWCTDILKKHGLTNVHTVLQGIDPRIFFPSPDPVSREFFRDRFVIFSGGKFEFRKGQDLVIRAVKVLMDRHKDVVLINSWFNPWQQSFDTMKLSPHLKWPNISGNYLELMNQLLAFNGLDPARTITLGPRPNALMARIYRNTDIGLFPNRCEGGTNLVLMEYMACGKPTIAAPTTGHADIVNPSNSLPIAIEKEIPIPGPIQNQPIALWPEPSLDSTIAQLEFAYQNRPALSLLATRTAHDLAHLTWQKTAQDFHRLLTSPS